MLAAAGRTLEVLLVEDDEVFVMCLRRALQKAESNVTLHVARDGLEALERLRGEGGDAPLVPHVILLDVNMPRMDGHRFLAELRADPSLREYIVYMLTTSVAATDVERAYGMQVAGYISKSSEGTRLPTVLGLLHTYQSGVVFPSRRPASSACVAAPTL